MAKHLDQHLPPKPTLGSSLVVGGCGFFGRHLVRHLLDDDSGGLVYVFDRTIDNNSCVPGAVYVQGHLSDSQAVHALLDRVRPRVVFHAASPQASLPARRRHEFYETNVKGTEVLLTEAVASGSVEALVFTSTVDVYAAPPHDNVDETHPLWHESAKTNEYARTKAVADHFVRQANGGQLRTVCLRPAHMYGERHTQGLYEILAAIERNAPLVQLGPGTNLMEVVSADNAAAVHLLAARALLDPSRNVGGPGSERVDGEAFNVSDGAPVPFWHHVRVIWTVARGKPALDSVWVIPVWVMAMAVFVAEWAYRVFTLGMVEPPAALTLASLSFCTESHTYSIEKARARLGFRPVANHDQVLAQSVRWELTQRGLPVKD